MEASEARFLIKTEHPCKVKRMRESVRRAMMKNAKLNATLLSVNRNFQPILMEAHGMEGPSNDEDEALCIDPAAIELR